MSNYTEVLKQARELTPEEQLKLINDLISVARHQVMARPRRSILELRGLGKEVWKDIDAQEYVNQERDSWNG
ncbi:hypothetical protein [Argonema antarcticum]|uniref:hypothetical protein n=1 Tax=Argonema antarcticum TaxID=2942763 RepID=UPI00201109D1|nr:hypothetical protein [Argonema antarcticum]MCL1473206.1 hypothetical protein [Argonema antarcticum A004/B2]